MAQPFASNHSKTSRCPPSAARSVAEEDHGHPFALSHTNTSKWPPRAADAHVFELQEHPAARAHRRMARWPPLLYCAREKTKKDRERKLKARTVRVTSILD